MKVRGRWKRWTLTGVLAGLLGPATALLAQDPPAEEPAAQEQPAAEPTAEPATADEAAPADSADSTESTDSTAPAATPDAEASAAPTEAAPAATPQPELKVLVDDTGSDRGSTRLDEIVVTANKRQQFLQDVPMSITAIRGADLEKMGAKSFIDYAQTVPALNFGYYGEGRARINIRGLQAPTGVATVAYLVDGVAQGESPPDAELFDIERIEVLRGPQGTLYGEGAMGGAIKILTNGANPLASLSKVTGSYGVNEAGAPTQDLNGMINLPLIENSLGLRMVGFQRHSDGYITVREPDHDNADPAARDYSSENIIKTNANTNDVHGGRLSLDWKAMRDLSVATKYSTQKSNAGYGPAESPELEKRYGEYQVTRGYNPLVGDFTRHDYRQGSVNVNWTAPFALVESVTGYADVKEDLLTGVFVDVDAQLAAEIGGIPLPSGTPETTGLGGMIEFRLINQYSYLLQEFRLASIPGEFLTFDGNFNWTVGLFSKIQSRQAFAELRDDGNFSGALDDDINLHFDSNEYALYGQGEYALTPKFSVLVGARYFRADLVQDAIGQGINGCQEDPDDPTTNCPRHHEFTYTDVSPKLTLSYHLTGDILLYTTAAKGFRSGGANFTTGNPPPENVPPTYDPDVLWSYEVGMNSVLFDGMMTVNTAVFMADWTNMQQDVRVENALGQGDRIVLNAGKAVAEGIELDTTTKLPWGFSLNAGGAYIEAEMGEDIPNPEIDGGFIPEGTPLENQPRKSCSASLNHLFTFSGGWGLNSAVLWSYRGRTHADILNHTKAVSAPYNLYNLQFGLKGAQDAWSADFFVKNVFNKRASSFTFPHLDTDLPMAWRTVGLRVNYSF